MGGFSSLPILRYCHFDCRIYVHRIVHSISLLSFTFCICSDSISFITDMDNLCLIFFAILARLKMFLLIFSRNQFLALFVYCFSVLISASYYFLSSTQLGLFSLLGLVSKGGNSSYFSKASFLLYYKHSCYKFPSKHCFTCFYKF